MKNVTPTPAKKRFSAALKMVIAGSMLFTSAWVSAQQLTERTGCQAGLAVSACVAANGYGTQYVPAFYLRANRQTWFFGPVVQKQKLNLSGFQLNFDYRLAGGDPDDNCSERTILFCFATIAGHSNARMGKQTMGIERLANRSYEGDLYGLRFKSVEGYTGFGVKIKLNDQLQWTTALGVGGYTSFNFPEHLYYSSHNMTLLIKTGFAVDLNR